jgi:putative transposase
MERRLKADPAEDVFSASTFLSPLHSPFGLSGESGESGLRQKKTIPSSMKHNDRRLNMKKRYTDTQIVAKLRQADVLIGQNKTVPEVCREIEVSQQTYYRWRQKYGGMNPEMIKEFRELQKENARLRKVVADQAIDNAILKEAAAKNF